VTGLELLGWSVVLALGVAALSIVASTLRLGISPMPTTPAVRAAMLELLAAPPGGGPIHELGCGWGGLALALAARFPERTVVAWERAPVPFLVTWLRARGRPNLEVRFADFLEADLSGAGALVCYLFTGGMQRLGDKLVRERPGAPLVIVTNTFLLRGWPVAAERRVDDLYRTVVARYDAVPASFDGA
jgi:hypothetical protein